MGTIISFHLKSPAATARQGIDQLQAIAQDLPFDYVGKVVELVGEECNYQNSDNEHLLVLKIQAVAKRIEQGAIVRTHTIDIASYRSGDMNMARVYLKGGLTVEVPLEELEDYLYTNADKIETRHIQRRRPPIDKTLDDVVIFN